jgi:hypothetical protein
MILPEKYCEVRSSLGFDQINLGASGVCLFKLTQIERGQRGYSVAANGSELCGNREGAWQRNWVVIGHDTGCGDPLILDTADPALPVLTDFHGQGKWNPVCIAIRLDTFVFSLKEFAKIANGRGTPVELDANPLTAAERQDFLGRISDVNHGRAAMDFWGSLLEE